MMRALFAALAMGLFFYGSSGLAHHGWAWTTGGNIELTGEITNVSLGNPHGILDADVDGETWTVSKWGSRGGTNGPA